MKRTLIGAALFLTALCTTSIIAADNSLAMPSTGGQMGTMGTDSQQQMPTSASTASCNVVNNNMQCNCGQNKMEFSFRRGQLEITCVNPPPFAETQQRQ